MTKQAYYKSHCIIQSQQYRNALFDVCATLLRDVLISIIDFAYICKFAAAVFLAQS